MLIRDSQAEILSKIDGLLKDSLKKQIDFACSNHLQRILDFTVKELEDFISSEVALKKLKLSVQD